MPPPAGLHTIIREPRAPLQGETAFGLELPSTGVYPVTVSTRL
jgi:hypothetical protein